MTLYSNPTVPLIENPINLDREIQTIQQAIGGLSWIEKSFGRAWNGRSFDVSRKSVTIPEVYQGSNEYYPCLPNDELTGQSFIRVQSDTQTVTEYSPYSPDKISCIIDIIITYRLDLINAGVTHRYNEELKKEVKDALKLNSTIKRIIRVYEDPADVFKGYTISHEEWQTFKHPRGGFRFECELAYTEDC